MINHSNINIQQMMMGTNAHNHAAGVFAKGLGGNAPQGMMANVGDEGQSADFISMIMARMQANGALPPSVAAASPSDSATDELKSRLQAIFAGLGQTEAPDENAGHAELFQNGTANFLPNLPQGQPEQSTQNSVAAPAMGGLDNNALLAQQLGLDPADESSQDILNALKDAFADMGIDIDAMSAEAAKLQQAIIQNAQKGEHSLPQQTIEPTNPAQEKSAHLQNLTSQQASAQKTSPAQTQQTDAGQTSPSHVDKSLTPQSPQDTQTAASAADVTGEDFLLHAQLNGSAIAGQSFLTADVAMRNAARSARNPANQMPQMTTTQNNGQIGQPVSGAASQSSPNTPSSPSMTADAVQMMAQASASSQNSSVGSSGGAASGSDFIGAQDFLSGQNGSLDNFNSDLTQRLSPDQIANQKAQMQQASHYNNSHYRPGAQSAPVVRAVTLNMTRGADNQINRMSLQLQPASFGRVDVELTSSKDGTLKAHIMTDKPETLQMLQRDSNALQKALEEAGLNLGEDSFTFDLRDQSNDNQLAQDKNDRETLFDVTGLSGEIADEDIDPSLLQNAAYGQQYIRPNGVNLYV